MFPTESKVRRPTLLSRPGLLHSAQEVPRSGPTFRRPESPVSTPQVHRRMASEGHEAVYDEAKDNGRGWTYYGRRAEASKEQGTFDPVHRERGAGGGGRVVL